MDMQLALSRTADQAVRGLQAVQNTFANLARVASRVQLPDIGNKLNYMFGQASGSEHNILRSLDMLRQLERIGLFDTPENRMYVMNHLIRIGQSTANIVSSTGGSIVRESLLAGPNGFVKLESRWEGTKLITFKLLGG